ncbi:hypothetical protein D3C75_916510 [compost metagenome]
MNNLSWPRATPVTGRFVLCSWDGKYSFNDVQDLELDGSGNPVVTDKEAVYFESSAGEGKAKYWTADAAQAQVFESLDSAVLMLLQCRNPADVRIRSVTDL